MLAYMSFLLVCLSMLPHKKKRTKDTALRMFVASWYLYMLALPFVCISWTSILFAGLANPPHTPNYYFITCTDITSSYTTFSLHHMHGYYFITCTTLTSSHALILLHHMNCYYFITCTALTSLHALLLLHHIQCDYFITCTVLTSSHTLLLLHHIQCS